MLSILCVTKCEAHAPQFLRHFVTVADLIGAEPVIVYDGEDAVDRAREAGVYHYGHYIVHSKGYIESVLDTALSFTTRPYVLRLDDDESMSGAMVQWLEASRYTEQNHWKFARAHLYGDTQHYLQHPQLWPDHQTRLSVREYAGGRSSIHAGSPFGGGHVAPCVLLHHKFLVKTYEERRAIADRYDGIQRGAGRAGGMVAFQLPEDCGYPLSVAPVNDGRVTTEGRTVLA